MGKKQKILFEDFNKIYNKWVSGIAKREAQSDVITVDDIVNQYRNNLDQGAPKQLPFPLDRSVDMLGDIFNKLTDYKQVIDQASRNPVIKENKNNIKQLEKIWKKVQVVQDVLFSMTVNLNKIAYPESVEKEEKEDN